MVVEAEILNSPGLIGPQFLSWVDDCWIIGKEWVGRYRVGKNGKTAGEEGEKGMCVPVCLFVHVDLFPGLVGATIGIWK